MSTKDSLRSGLPKEVVTDQNIKKNHKIILNDRKLKLNEIADPLKISTERVWMKHGSVISLRNHLNGLHTMNPLQSVGKVGWRGYVVCIFECARNNFH
ncbi:hypothetical protein GWI33_021265 [Rhynchophorus ferrugineus]|uniref:Uncharacterized protein n=1 Tax=Rhynchophorus ferrugineus TaxID=354439 RepID=A0A834LYQ4_RHYFE|nr:hypothetical protein GWI33_021265 [Rhynchophorus ferrugineus]